MYFLSVGTIPLGGLKFGYPSVNKIVKTFLFLKFIFFIMSKDIRNPYHMLVVPVPYSYFIRLNAFCLLNALIFFVENIRFAPVLNIIKVS